MVAEQYMKMAIELAVENVRTGRGGPFGAVVVRGGEVLATGVNQVTATNDPTAHAEVTAIRNACRVLGVYQLEGATIYSSCEPCPMCLAAIYWARCSGVIYGCNAEDAAAAGFDDARLHAELRRPVGAREMAEEQMCRNEALAAFAAWREFSQRIVY
jgi:tRNA(Arg) A34 adenosine deaminase TadA